jgi:predicted PP-loop superfamily ATPase
MSNETNTALLESAMLRAALKRIVERCEVFIDDEADMRTSSVEVLMGIAEDALSQPDRAQDDNGVLFGYADRSVRVSQEAYAIFMDRERGLEAQVAALGDEVERLYDAIRYEEARARLALAESEQLRAERDGLAARVVELEAALDHIGGLSRALRVGGPDPMDLEGLSDALTVAVDIANAALAQPVKEGA